MRPSTGATENPGRIEEAWFSARRPRTAGRAVRRFEALGSKADVAPFLAALGGVSNANKQLGATFDGMSPKANSSCLGYSDTVASVIGHGRDVARDIPAKGNPSQPAQRFNETYNRSVRDFESRQKNESRVRSG